MLPMILPSAASFACKRDAQIESVKAQNMTERDAGTDATGEEIIADVNSWYTTWIESNADFTHSARNVNQKFADLGLN